jgi:hypothetical protein
MERRFTEIYRFVKKEMTISMSHIDTSDTVNPSPALKKLPGVSSGCRLRNIS